MKKYYIKYYDYEDKIDIPPSLPPPSLPPPLSPSLPTSLPPSQPPSIPPSQPSFLPSFLSVLRRQSRDTNRTMKRLVYMPIRIVKSNVASVGPSSERNRKGQRSKR